MKAISFIFLSLFCLYGVAMGEDITHSGVISNLPGDFVELLAKAQIPDDKGALGRNRKQYIHARFQYRIHHLADYAVRQRDLKAAAYFTQALEYAFKYQTNEGGFKFDMPTELKAKKAIRRGDMASGTALFLSSATAGILSLQQSDWFIKSVQLTPLKLRVEKLNSNIKSAGNFLFREKKILLHYDANAPNRLLIDALAFHALGNHLQNAKFTTAANTFVQLAVEQQHPDGYFIEAGGYDSSYNGVAIATGYRLLMFQPDYNRLGDALAKAVKWQESRVSNTGEISMQGNRRVFVGGETFWGEEKRIDISHVVEGFMLASVIIDDKQYLKVARKIMAYYQNKLRLGSMDAAPPAGVNYNKFESSDLNKKQYFINR